MLAGCDVERVGCPPCRGVTRACRRLDIELWDHDDKWDGGHVWGISLAERKTTCFCMVAGVERDYIFPNKVRSPSAAHPGADATRRDLLRTPNTVKLSLAQGEAARLRCVPPACRGRGTATASAR